MKLPCSTLLLSLALAAPTLASAATLPTPSEFTRLKIGEDRVLADYRQIRGYFQELDRLSPRITVQNLGKTTLGEDMFMAIITYGQWVATSVAEEKASRVMELLITAATPRQLLLGKVMGAGGAGLIQYVAIVGAALLGLLLVGPLNQLINGESGGEPPDLSALSIGVLLVVGLFFVGGFGLYSTLYAALGSTASRQEEVQNITGPMIIVGVAGYLISFAALNAPDADWVKVLSFVPFFSPYLIPTRMVMGEIAPWEIGLAFMLLVAGALAALWVAARIYSAGVLLYGQKAGLRNVWRAVRVNR